MARLAAKARCNYYPLPDREAELIRSCLAFPANSSLPWTLAPAKAEPWQLSQPRRQPSGMGSSWIRTAQRPP
jgi:hypothetical protein